jgi:hypothetical protein
MQTHVPVSRGNGPTGAPGCISAILPMFCRPNGEGGSSLTVGLLRDEARRRALSYGRGSDASPHKRRGRQRRNACRPHTEPSRALLPDRRSSHPARQHRRGVPTAMPWPRG